MIGTYQPGLHQKKEKKKKTGWLAGLSHQGQMLLH